MKTYDPETAPDPEEWLQLDEQQRINLAEEHHRSERIELPNVKAHAAFHAIVENQIAEGLDSVIRALERLRKEGLSRHEAVHAIASVVTDQFYDLMHGGSADAADVFQARYNAAVERLTVKEWHRKHGA